ncbi:uncharacterized protein OCT59_009887 [Rhizophagus irregularis]|uniref:Hsp70 family ATPase ECM10 n=2 Tax=Rhizophagus irregularis TaxID=588596 RepID=A0A015K424_RHIIW|nr:Hsp70 family ATPase ECM10 [Rhizophagus irregularis DAOM 197198w]UZO18575.1 hypothetical protein OCT59_009887 [Rhizophagus irregularis]GBC29285.1 hypothetical protein GLOIN_2v1716501 [Rhizophagus irregularis DAOM 181602=DAOM 197198]
MSEIRVVVAIDFGTTYSGFAYAHRSNPNEITAYCNWQDYNARFKTFTVLKYDESLKLISWGYPALAEKPNRRKKPSNIKPVERFKLHLGDMENKPYLPEGFDFKTAITDYLREMGIVIKETIKTKWQKIDFFRQVLIVMTIPAEFDSQAMKIMRKCAYDAGIINEGSENLEFTTEPEAAAVYCMKKKEYHIGVGSSFMIVDCGGGTVDLTTRKLLEGDKLEEVTEREGDFCGGSFVDDEFLKFIGEKVGESALKLVRKNHYSQLQYMVQDFCRRVKIQFTGQESHAQTHEFDLSKLCPVLKQCVKGEKYDEMEEMEWIVELTFDDVKLMFNPVIERIISLIHKQLDKSHENGYDICAMFLVGGFSESKYLQARIKKEFGDKVPNISVPIQPVTAVVRGAVQFGLEKEIIKTRVLKWTYGTDVAKKWGQGDPIKRKRSDGRVLKFSRLAKRGDQVAVNEKIVKTYYPPNTVQKKLGLDIYVTRKDNATYCDEPGVELLDSWCVDIPNASKENRAFEFTLTFGKVEIEAIAQAKTGEKYENTFDLDM